MTSGSMQSDFFKGIISPPTEKIGRRAAASETFENRPTGLYLHITDIGRLLDVMVL